MKSLWSISQIYRYFQIKYSLNISRQSSKPFWFLKCPALRRSGECSNCFVRVATCACYGHVMHTSAGAQFSVAGQVCCWIFQTFRRCDVIFHATIMDCMKNNGQVYSLFWKQDKTVTKKGAFLRKCREKRSGDSVPLRDWRHVEFRDSFRCLTLRWFCGNSLVAFYDRIWPAVLKTYFMWVEMMNPPKSFSWVSYQNHRPRPFFKGDFKG